MRTVHKLVAEIAGRLYSISLMPEGLRVEYIMGKEIRPAVGMLFCFDTVHHAKQFRKHVQSHCFLQLLTCEVEEVTIPKSRFAPNLTAFPIGDRKSLAEYYWRSYTEWEKESSAYCIPESEVLIPTGTILTSCLIPREKLYI